MKKPISDFCDLIQDIVSRGVRSEASVLPGGKTTHCLYGNSSTNSSLAWRALCCKSGTEYNQFYDYLKNHTDGENQIKWYCHFDDDIYVNVKELSKLLAKYNSSKPYYIGRNPRGPGGVQVDLYRLGVLKRNYHVNKTSYLYAAGAAYCNSLALMKELYKYFRSPKEFQDTCERTKTTDDLTVGAIIGMVLNHGLTNNKAMQNQAVSLKLLSMANLTKMVTVSYRTDRKDRQKIINVIDPKPRRFTVLQDPTRFLTYHCLLYNQTSWCQADSPGPPIVLESQQRNLSTSSNQTSRSTTSSNQTVSQPSKAPTTASNQDKTPPNNSNAIPPSQNNSNTTPPNNQDNSNAIAQDNSNEIPPNNKDNSNTTLLNNQDKSQPNNSNAIPQEYLNKTPPNNQENSNITPPNNQDKTQPDNSPPNNQTYMLSHKTVSDQETSNNHNNLQRSSEPIGTVTGVQNNSNNTPMSNQSHLQNSSAGNGRTNQVQIPTSNQTLSQQSNAPTTVGDQNKTTDHGNVQRSDKQRLKEITIVESHSNEIHQTQLQSLNTESTPTT